MTPSPGWERNKHNTQRHHHSSKGVGSTEDQHRFYQNTPMPYHTLPSFQSDNNDRAITASGLPTVSRPRSTSPPNFAHQQYSANMDQDSHRRMGQQGKYNNYPNPSSSSGYRPSYHQQIQHDTYTSTRPSSSGGHLMGDLRDYPPSHRSRDRSYTNQSQTSFQQRSSPNRYSQSSKQMSHDEMMMNESEGSGSRGSPMQEANMSNETPSSSGNRNRQNTLDNTTGANASRSTAKSSTATNEGSTEASTSTAATTNAGGENREAAAAARKQNSACDACRNRKVRCHRTPGEEKCNHCKAKGIECTTIYVQLATQGVKRPIKRQRGEIVPEGDATPTMGEDVPLVVRYLLLRDNEYADVVYGLSYAEIPGKRIPPTTAAETRLINATARQEFVSSLLETYFSTVHIRYPVLDPQEFLQRFHYQTPELGGAPPDVLTAVLLAWGAKFSTHPIIVADRRETAHDELTPTQRLRRSVNNPLANRALASSHGESSSSRSGTGSSGKGESTAPELRDASKVMGRSRIAEDLIVKAQEVLDRNKAHRIANIDNAKAAIIVQALFWQQASQSDSNDAISLSQLRPARRRGVYICNGSWINASISHMFEMRVHLQGTIDNIAEEGQRGQVAMAWWLACMFDAHMSAFYRRKPILAAEDYSTKAPAPPRTGPVTGPSPLAAEEGYRIWLNSALDQCEMMRSVYFTLWTPCAYEEGISARKLEKLVSAAYRWRSSHLALVGAPDTDWPSQWKFADAVTACSSDLNYHVVWLLMWQAIDEYGIAELKANNLAQYNAACTRHGTSSGLPVTMAEMELDQSKVNGMRNAIYEEALKAALRSANLAKMLHDFDYLQNEAGIMKFTLSEAGYCLTRFKRPEVYMIIDGLRQYGQAFEECYEQADELERLALEYSAPQGSSQKSAALNMGKGGKHSSTNANQRPPWSADSASSSNSGPIFGFSASNPNQHNDVPMMAPNIQASSGGGPDTGMDMGYPSSGQPHMMRNNGMPQGPPPSQQQQQQQYHMPPQHLGPPHNNSGSFNPSNNANYGHHPGHGGQLPGQSSHPNYY